MKQKTIVVVGGGYAGLHTIASLRKQWGDAIGKSVRLILLDKQTYHYKKVVLVKAPTRPVDLRVPFSSFDWNDVECLQGELTQLSEQQAIQYKTSEDDIHSLAYDQLVIAVGSVFKKRPEERGGFILSNETDGQAIQKELSSLKRKAWHTDDLTKREQLLHATVVGGGITGIEIAAELASYLRKEGAMLGLDKHRQPVNLIHSGNQLLTEASSKVGKQLEEKVRKIGIQLIKNTKAKQYKDGVVILDKGELSTGLCVWALGMAPNPLVQSLGLPVHEDGRVVVDSSYRVKRCTGIYAIGDCAHVIDAKTGKVDGMNCKEAVVQAGNLGKVMKADLEDRAAPTHRGIANHGYCIALGPNDGFLWGKYLGIDFVIPGNLAGKAKEYAWKTASEVK